MKPINSILAAAAVFAGTLPAAEYSVSGKQFSAAIPEGNYRVTVTLGDEGRDCETTVLAESRRLMLDRVRTAAGKIETRVFTVNLRDASVPAPPQNAPGGDRVRLNAREAGVLHWDDKLSLEFAGAQPCATRVAIDPADDLPTIYLAGDSTVTDQPRAPIASWGQMLPRFFKPSVVVANHAESGETMKSFLTGLRLDKLLSRMKKGDYVFIQFGHNDQKANWPQTYVEASTTYRQYLKVYIAEARRRGATPVLVSSMQRRNFDAAGKVRNTHGEYPEAMRQVALEEGVTFIDLTAMSVRFYEALGPERSARAFAPNDATHHSQYGAFELARGVAAGIRAAVPALAMHLADDVPASTAAPAVYVIGDSTASNANRRGWGDPLADYFDVAQARVVNRARAGRSSRTFLTEGLWDKVREELKPGDFVLMQFGHNDGGAPDRDRARGSLPGLGDESKEFTLQDGRRETVHTFGWYMRKFIAEAKAKGATPLVLSLTVRNIWKDGRVERGSGQYSTWSAEIAKAGGVAFADVMNAIADRYEVLGEARVKEFFPEDHTHPTPAAADLHASLVVSALKGINSPLATMVSQKGAALAAYPIPMSLAAVRSFLAEPRDTRLPTLFLIGDSTVRNGTRADGANGQWGWGEPLVDLFETRRINVVNRALGGLSSRTYLTLGHWARVHAMLKPGDFVIMQFGHNDSGAPDDPARARATLPGTGAETREIDNPITKEHETVHTYGWYLKRFVAEARAKGAIPIVCSPVPRKVWKDGKIVRSSETYQKWAAEVAASERAPFLDLNEIISRQYDQLGAEKVDPLFGDAQTHTSRAGAELNARSVVAGLKALARDPLAGYYSR